MKVSVLRRLRLSRRTRRWVIAVAIIAVGIGIYLHWHQQPEKSPYITAEVSRGPIIRTITTTGAVDPVITVEVGAYVSGTMQACYCDYNTQVKAGQLCAKIDPRPYQVIVDEATANLGNAQAQLRKDQAALAYAKINYDRDSQLRKHGVVSQDTIDSDKSVLDENTAQVKVDESTIAQRQAELHAAQVNLDYTNIISPVDGTVVARNITIGQTVAASFQTPTLFLIAQDLTKMQADTNVSESDVGAADVGQKASFTVEAYPGRTFWGKVSQVRKAPITVQNVVTYDVVVSVDNPDLALLPGMTANTHIITDERQDVIRVPLKALGYSPQGVRRAAGPDKPNGKATVWILRDGEPVKVPVTVGLKDGGFAEIVKGELQPGDRVILDEIAGDGKGSKGNGAPFGMAGPHMHGMH